MLDIIGTSYLIDHFIHTYKEDAKKKAFSFFVSELLRSVNNNIAKAFGGYEYPKSWKDIVESLNKPKETRTEQEIRDHMMKLFKATGDVK